ncbi:hypothetical protein FXO38_01446 [Capsicum annuum]|nr:hypothetical protein FXO38_01446 [Capsicum annuum]
MVRGEISLEPRASWFSPKCVEAQQLTGYHMVKNYFSAGCKSGTKLRQTLNTRYGLKKDGSKSANEMMVDKLHRLEGNNLNHQLRTLNDCSVIKEVGVRDRKEVCLESAILERGLTPALYQKVKEVGDLIAGEPTTEALMNGGRNYNDPKVEKLLVGLGGRQRRTPFGGAEPSVRYHSGRAKILTLCQDLWSKGQSQTPWLSQLYFGFDIFRANPSILVETILTCLSPTGFEEIHEPVESVER